MRKSERDREPWLGPPVLAKANETFESVALEDHLKPLVGLLDGFGFCFGDV